MKIYNPVKIKKLYSSIEENLTDEQQEIMKEILGNYNMLYVLARDKTEYVQRKEIDYVNESEENNKLRIKVDDLEKKLERQIKINEFFQEELKNKTKEGKNNAN